MRAVVYTRFGGPEVLGLREVPRPVPTQGEVLIRVRATTVTSAETGMRQGRPVWGRVILGFTRPRRKLRTLGLEFAGEVAEVGSGVSRFRPGDQVFGFTGFSLGANADYLCLPEKASLAVMPAGATYEQAAAAVDGASTALFFLRDKARVRSGQRVLVVGASGSIGMYAVQLARHFGAHVTGVCSGGNAELVKSLGADAVVDYTRQDYSTMGERYDIVFDTVGRSSFPAARKVLNPTGLYLPTTGLANHWYRLRASLTRGPKVMTGMSVDKTRALPFLRDLIEQGRLRVVIDRSYPLEQIAQAHRYVDTGRKHGNVVVTL